MDAAQATSPPPAHRLTRFLWWCAGSVPEILATCPTERARHAGIGGAVLSTWCLASLAGGYALYTMSAGSAMRWLTAAAGGVVWGLVIFNIDRFLVSSLRKSGERSLRGVLRAELLPASPRILFAIVIAFTIAEPIEMRLFAPEIEDRVDANRDALVADRQSSLRALAASQVAAWQGEAAQIDRQLADSRARVERLQREYVEESDGRGGSRQVGDGPLTRIKRAEAERAAAEHRSVAAAATARRTDLQQRIDRADADLARQLADYRASLGDGYLARREALTNLYEERPGVWGAVWGIFALMVLVEITPLLLKLFAPFGPYDARLLLAEESSVHEARLEKHYRIAAAAYHYTLAEQAERAVEDASHAANVAVRSGKVRQAWAAFDEGFAPRPHPTVDRLVAHLRSAFTAHRNA